MTTIIDRTDHNRFANEQQQRYVEQRLRELNAFEVRASGLANPFVNTATASARVATPPTGAMTMNVHQSDALSRPSSLLQPAVSSSAFLKAGILGFQGGGKTLTSAKCLIGLYKYTLEMGLHDGTKPVAMLDTEKGSDWLIPIFAKAGVPFVVAKRKAFADTLKVMDEAEHEAFGLLIDSITHPWRELVESYLRKKERSYLAMDDWGYLKGEHGWQQFTDRFVNSKLHIVMAGRAGFEYENYVEDGRKKMEKVGTKMKTEGETGYEPDLLILMEQVEDLRTGKVVHRATVQKDRSTLLDGKQFDNPDFADFLPHIKCLALGGAHIGISANGDSQHLLKLQKRDWTPVQREICADEIKSLMELHYPSQNAEDKKARLKLMLEHFNATWTEIEKVMPLEDMRAGYDSLHQALNGKPSKYGSAITADSASLDMNDGLPAGMAPLKDITLSAQALATPLVKAALQDAAAGPEDDGIPSYLKRQAEPATTPLAPAEPEIDEPKFLAEVTKALEGCINFVNYGDVQENILNPAKPKLSAQTWEKASRLAMKTIKRLMNTEVPGASFAAAAE